jgi:Fur family zinc uptake transcriptional regulator
MVRAKLDKERKQPRGRNQEHVIKTLRKARRPLTAYEVLDLLRAHGVSAPPTVYRALDKLIAEGLAHKLDSLNAFVACNQPHRHKSAAFAICHKCGTVTEFPSTDVNKRLGNWAAQSGFLVKDTNFEVRGECTDCQQSAEAGETQEL